VLVFWPRHTPRSYLFPYTTLFRSHALVATKNIGRGVSLGMADVQPGPAGIREHIKDIELGPPGIDVDRAECLVPLPFRLPLRLRSEEHTSELQSLTNLVCRLLLAK